MKKKMMSKLNEKRRRSEERSKCKPLGVKTIDWE